MSSHELYKVGGRVGGQGVLAKTRVLADEVLLGVARIQVDVGEVATTAARDADFFCDLFCVINQ